MKKDYIAPPRSKQNKSKETSEQLQSRRKLKNWYSSFKLKKRLRNIYVGNSS
jgi:hypothetical protein